MGKHGIPQNRAWEGRKGDGPDKTHEKTHGKAKRKYLTKIRDSIATEKGVKYNL